MTDEKSILEQFAAGNHTAFRELFMRYHLKVYYFVLGLVKSESDAEDLTQEIFLKLWTHRSRFTEVRTSVPTSMCWRSIRRQLYRIPPGESRELRESRGGRRGTK